ncbi:MAG: autotransporter outer membrane beta-barrel domain-containing protein [Magnetococcales bacterium]|nr:autotransporter outer membrane beta-barrel domain-containing protein [Magnetococcales bacterium]
MKHWLKKTLTTSAVAVGVATFGLIGAQNASAVSATASYTGIDIVKVSSTYDCSHATFGTNGWFWSYKWGYAEAFGYSVGPVPTTTTVGVGGYTGSRLLGFGGKESSWTPGTNTVPTWDMTGGYINWRSTTTTNGTKQGLFYATSTTYKNTNCFTNHTGSTAGTAVIGTQVLRAATQLISGTILGRINQVRHASRNGTGVEMGGHLDEKNGMFGMSTGEAGEKWGVWAHGSFTNIEDDHVTTKMDGHVWSVMAGLDYKVTPDVLLGLSLGYGFSDIDTQFNNGEVKGEYYTISPYLGWTIDKIFSLDVAFGLSWGEIDQKRTGVGTGTEITSNPDAERYFWTIMLNADTMVDNWRLGGEMGILYTEEDVDAFMESNNVNVAKSTSKLGQWRIGGDVAYSFGVVEPYLHARIEYDFEDRELEVATNQQTPADDDTGGVIGAGMRFNFSPTVTGGIDWEHTVARSNLDAWTLAGRIRLLF